MPVDWKTLEKEIDAALDRAEKRTDEQLCSLVSSLTRLTDEEVQKLFPKPADVEKLKKLMEIVKSSEKRNIKVINLTKNIEDLAETAIKLLEVFA
jgi:hypothetical protein